MNQDCRARAGPRADVCRGDGRFPLRDILQHDRLEFCRARRNRVHAVGIESIENGFLLNRRLDRTCDFVDDFLWRAGRNANRCSINSASWPQ